MARPAAVPNGSDTAAPAEIELAIRLLEARNTPQKVEAALVYRGSTKKAARELVQGILSGRIKRPPSENDWPVPTDWASLRPPYLLALGLLLLTGTVAIAVNARRIYLAGLVAGLLISCAGLQAL